MRINASSTSARGTDIAGDAWPRGANRPAGAGVLVPSVPGERPAGASTTAAGARTASGLDARYDFDSFVVGRSNRLAHAAALSVAGNGPTQYNPLFIHGESGNGKTHLLHAIGLHVGAADPHAEVRYVTSDQLTSELIGNLTAGGGRTRFSVLYRGCSLLLVDDLQFLEGKVETQTELFHTFDEVTAAGGRVVLSADRHPGAITTLPDRLRSRFTSGLVADLEAPDFDTRVAILARKATTRSCQVPIEVLHLIAGAVTRNVRELEGALTRVVAEAGLAGCPLTADTAAGSLSSYLGRPSEPVSAARVLEEASEVFGVSVDDLCGYGRTGGLVLARQAAMYVCRALTDDSLPAIGRSFGGRDHTTVLHGVRKIEQLVAERGRVQAKVAELTYRLGGRPGGRTA